MAISLRYFYGLSRFISLLYRKFLSFSMPNKGQVLSQKWWENYKKAPKGPKNFNLRVTPKFSDGFGKRL